jgi:hypothetical protein
MHEDYGWLLSAFFCTPIRYVRTDLALIRSTLSHTRFAAERAVKARGIFATDRVKTGKADRIMWHLTPPNK